jgi:DNA helicase-2/ATP-dependent DNA helicase PcrA
VKAIENDPPEAMGPLLDYYLPQLKRKYDDYPKRIKDLEHLRTMSARFKGLHRFLSELTLEPPTASVAGVIAPPEPEDERLILSTIHSAKGLEWHTVFVISAVEGRFPSAQSFGRPEELEEERRLMYVATTRARENLYISYPVEIYDWTSGMALSKPSRFVANLPSSLLERWVLQDEREDEEQQVLTPRPLPPPVQRPAPKEAEKNLVQGSRVQHPVFGTGTFIRYTGEEKVDVLFDRFGLKRIHLGYTKLEEVRQ